KGQVGDPRRRERPPRAGVALGSDSGAPGASTGCRAGRRHAANLGGGYRLSDLLLRRFAGDPLLGGLVRGPGPIETGFAAALSGTSRLLRWSGASGAPVPRLLPRHLGAFVHSRRGLGRRDRLRSRGCFGVWRAVGCMGRHGRALDLGAARAGLASSSRSTTPRVTRVRRASDLLHAPFRRTVDSSGPRQAPARYSGSAVPRGPRELLSGRPGDAGEPRAKKGRPAGLAGLGRSGAP